MAKVTLELTIDDVPGYKTGDQFYQLAVDAFAERHRMPEGGDKETFFAEQLVNYIASQIGVHQIYVATQSAKAAAEADNDKIKSDIVGPKKIKVTKKP